MTEAQVREDMGSISNESLQAELENVRAAAALIEENKNDELSVLRQKYEGEIASLQRILKEAVADALHTGEKDRLRLMKANEMMELQLHDLRQQLQDGHGQQNGLFTNMLRNFKIVSSPNSNNDCDPNAADEGVRMRMLLETFEAEIKSLRTQLVHCERRSKAAERKSQILETRLLHADASEIENVPGIGDGLKETTKGDLQILVAVLTTQKQVLQEDMNSLKERFHGITGQLDLVGRDVAECQRIGADILSGKQLAEDSAQRLLQLSQQLENVQKACVKVQRCAATDLVLSPDDPSSAAYITCEENTDESPITDVSFSGRRRSQSFGGSDQEVAAGTALSEDTVIAAKKSHSTDQLVQLDVPQPTKTAVLHNLEQASDTDSLNADQLSLGGEIKTGTCEMCINYEQKLQQMQDVERRLQQDLQTAKAIGERFRKDMEREQEYRSESEQKMSALSDQLLIQAEEIMGEVRLATYQLQLEHQQAQYDEMITILRTEVDHLQAEREKERHSLEKLQNAYDQLLGCHRKVADELRNEAIDLPQTVEELQEVALHLREELIECRAAKEHVEQSLRSEISFLKSQVESEQHSKGQLEDVMTEEINTLRTELGVSQSKINRLQGNVTERDELQKQHRVVQDSNSKLQQERADAQKNAEKWKSELSEAKKKVHALQIDLDNSEAVQRDFVRLSQSLQIELEKIRQAEHEVRWQHEDDVILCNQCKQPFSKTRRKLHCLHCGKIFCPGCLVRSVPSGPQMRPSPVCDVCHTILVRTTAPYFATQAPQT